MDNIGELREAIAELSDDVKIFVTRDLIRLEKIDGNAVLDFTKKTCGTKFVGAFLLFANESPYEKETA